MCTFPATRICMFFWYFIPGLNSAHSACTFIPPPPLFQAFANKVMRGIQLQYVFSKCFKDAHSPGGDDNVKGLALGADAPLMAAVAELKAAYRGEVAANRALCHGDLHPGSGQLVFIYICCVCVCG